MLHAFSLPQPSESLSRRGLGTRSKHEYEDENDALLLLYCVLPLSQPDPGIPFPLTRFGAKFHDITKWNVYFALVWDEREEESG